MKISTIRIAVISAVLLLASAYGISKARPELVPEPVREVLPSDSNLKSFEFLGCSGDWTDEKIQPQVWRTGRKNKITFLAKHPADCGYTIGDKPKAIISDTTVDLSYSMSNDDGTLAACYCEYWATFELKSAPDKVTKVSVNGEDAQLMSSLSER